MRWCKHCDRNATNDENNCFDPLPGEKWCVLWQSLMRNAVGGRSWHQVCTKLAQVELKLAPNRYLSLKTGRVISKLETDVSEFRLQVAPKLASAWPQIGPKVASTCSEVGVQNWAPRRLPNLEPPGTWFRAPFYPQVGPKLASSEPQVGPRGRRWHAHMAPGWGSARSTHGAMAPSVV